MTQNMIVETTANFIRANEKNLQLAFQVEKAMPVVREELIKGFFECVKKQLTEIVGATQGWEIQAIGTEGLWVCKSNWERLKPDSDPNWDPHWWGIRLLPKRPNWPHASISVANVKEIAGDKREQIEDKFRKCVGSKCHGGGDGGGPHIWHYFENELKDFQNFDFLRKMVDKPKQSEIAEDLAEKLAGLAETVDEALR